MQVNEKANPLEGKVEGIARRPEIPLIDTSISMLIGDEASRPDMASRKEEKKGPFGQTVGCNSKMWFLMGNRGKLNIIETRKATLDGVPSPLRDMLRGLQRAWRL